MVADWGCGSSVPTDFAGTAFRAQHFSARVSAHVTIGTLDDRSEAKALCDDLNSAGVSIRGRLATLTVADFRDGGIVELASIALGGSTVSE